MVAKSKQSRGKPAFPTLSCSHLSAHICMKAFQDREDASTGRSRGLEGGLAPALMHSLFALFYIALYNQRFKSGARICLFPS